MPEAGCGKSEAPIVRVARGLSDFAEVLAIRAAVYMGGQSCPYDEEFDGNDLAGLHLIAGVGCQPAGTMRIRFFAEFAKLERLAVLDCRRRSSASFALVRHGIQLCRRKGYCKIYGHAQDRLVPFWKRFGAVPMSGRPKLAFSDFEYTEMLLTTEPLAGAITLESDPYAIIRPEGDWDRPGVLEKSRERGGSSVTGDRWGQGGKPPPGCPKLAAE